MTAPGAEPVAEVAGAPASRGAAAPGDAAAESDGSGGPAALADLVAAGLVSHEMIGDPARLGRRPGAEAATLRVLCAHVPGSIWRIEPYHYAFRLEAGDAEAGDAEAVGAALEARLAAELGADAAWVNATDLIAPDLGSIDPGDAAVDGAAGAGAAAIDLDAPLLLLRAGAEAVADGLAFAGSGVQAVVSAGFAARAARIAADRMAEQIADQTAAGQMAGQIAAPDPELALRLAGLEMGQARIEAALAAEAEARAAAAAAELRLTELLAKVLRRLDAQADVLHGHIAREDRVAEKLGEIAALAAGTAGSGTGDSGAGESGAAAAFQESLGLVLAEFLARLERREAAPARVPQVS